MQPLRLPIPLSPSRGWNGSIRFFPAITPELCPGGSAMAGILSRVVCSRDTGRAMSSNMISEDRSSAAAARQIRSAPRWGTPIFVSIRIARSPRERLKPISWWPLPTRSNGLSLIRCWSSWITLLCGSVAAVAELFPPTRISALGAPPRKPWPEVGRLVRRSAASVTPHERAARQVGKGSGHCADAIRGHAIEDFAGD